MAKKKTKEKKTIAEDIKEVYSEAKGAGLDPKYIRKIIQLRKLDVDDREEQETLLDIYMAAMGMKLLDEDEEV